VAAVNGLTAARALRRSLEEGTGVLRISVAALGDVFGRGRVTGRTRAGIEDVLRRAGLEVEPPLTDPATDWVTLRVAAPATEDAAHAPAAVRPDAPQGRRPRLLLPVSLAAALAFVFPLLLAGAIVLPDDGPDAAPPRTVAEPAAAVVDPRQALLDRADTALLAGDYWQAIGLTRQADPSRVAGVRETVVTALLTQARTARRNGRHADAIRLVRRAARFGRAPGARRLVERSQRVLERRRAREERAERRRR
jgi:hypothetical protein